MLENPPLPGTEQYEELFKDNVWTESHGWLSSNLKQASTRFKVRLVERESRLKIGRILDYGAQYGHFSDAMISRGWKVTSLERHFEKRRFSLEVFHHRMLDLPELERLLPESFDVITMWHSLDYLQHPEAVIATLKSLLKPSGLLIMSVSNNNSADARFYGQKWAALDLPRKTWHFGIINLMKWMLKQGFTMTSHSSMPYEAVYISMLSDKHRFIGLCRGIGFNRQGKRDRRNASTLCYVFRKTDIAEQ